MSGLPVSRGSTVPVIATVSLRVRLIDSDSAEMTGRGVLRLPITVTPGIIIFSHRHRRWHGVRVVGPGLGLGRSSRPGPGHNHSKGMPLRPRRASATGRPGLSASLRYRQ